MNILVNALLLNNHSSGVQYSIEHTLEAMKCLVADTDTLKVILARHYKGQLLNSGLKVLTPGFNTNSRRYRVVWENLMLPFILKQNRHNHFIYHSPAYVLPPFCPSSSVVTVHDLIALEQPGWCQNETAVYFNALIPVSIRRASRIIAVSNRVKSDIVSRFNTDPEKIDVIYHGVHPGFQKIFSSALLMDVKRKYNLPDRFLLFVGNLEPKKNIPFLLRAFAEFKRTGLDYKLVIVGRKGWKYEPVFNTCHELRLEGDVNFLGYVPLEDLPAIYNLSSLFVFPSLYEGFGLPVLEAMACGVPVVTSNRGALPEIAAGCATLVPPDDVTGMARAMNELLCDENFLKKRSEDGLKHAAGFTWRKTAEQTYKTYERMEAC